ncbi:MAG: polysaccharide deacetylase family protein [Candidatus Omnitrophica bacterium]|nr:polysaccharide deacetylase family protein [Candidatus Omnitrophota bacterium]
MNGIKILLYHSVGDIDPRDNLGIRVAKEDFYRQMRFLKEDGYSVCTLKDAVEKIEKKISLREKATVITFDDGYKDNILNASPIIEGFSFPATFFVTVNYIGAVKTSPKRDWQSWECMDWDDLKELLKRGHNIGSHGVRHVDLCGLTAKERKEELKLSKKSLESALDEEIDFLSYPYGSFDDELTRLARETGYKAACTVAGGVNGWGADPFRLKRIEIVREDTKKSFKDKLEDIYDR